MRSYSGDHYASTWHYDLQNENVIALVMVTTIALFLHVFYKEYCTTLY